MNFGVQATLLALIFLSSINCAPTRTTRSPYAHWYKKGPSFILKLWNHLVQNRTTLSQLGASRVHGIYALVKQLPQSMMPSAKVFDLTSPLNRSSLPLNKVFVVDLHLNITAKPGVLQGDCNLVLNDIKSGTEVISKDIPCNSWSKLALRVTSSIKNWIKNPSSNTGMRVTISAKSSNYSVSSLPFISTDPRIEPPYYILYV